MIEPSRGEIWTIEDLKGNTHHGVIVSADKRNQLKDSVIIAQCTSGQQVYELIEVDISNQGVNHATKCQSDELYTIPKANLENKIGELEDYQLQQLNQCLKNSLKITP